jgi:uncharacterized membrane protein YphA (DoxX/SURF4 family)
MRTVPWKVLAVVRVAAGLPLLGFGLGHLAHPEAFRAVLVTAKMPYPEQSLLAAPLAECVAGSLLIVGLFARIGGFVGFAVMVPAVWATINLQNVPVAGRPPVPHIALPVAVMVCSLAALTLGAGRYSLDHALTARRR